MKNTLVAGVTVALLYLGYDFLNPPLLPPPPPPVVVRATPVPAPAPKVYFHSALDAGPMATNQHTGAGYFSTDAESRFTGGPYYGSGYYSGGGGPVVYGSSGAPAARPSVPSSPLVVAAAQADAQRAAASRAAAFNAEQQARSRASQPSIGTAR